MPPTEPIRRSPRLAAALALASLAAACALAPRESAERHRWWSGLGPVLPHDSFPADCTLCHLPQSWNRLRSDFDFDHEAETGIPLRGAHEGALCLRCHNDRGPVADFWAQGCQGCHEDVHLGELGPRCASCHDERSFVPAGQFELHYRTRFPLVGAHAQTACRRCHPGTEVGRFRPVDVACASCHQADLARTTNHVGLGWVDRCDRCHMPTAWKQAEIR
jgi:hypothetical protein